MKRTKTTLLVTLEVHAEFSDEMTITDVKEMIRSDPPYLNLCGAGTFGKSRIGSYSYKTGRVRGIKEVKG